MRGAEQPISRVRQVKDYERYKRVGGRNEEEWAKFVRRAFSFLHRGA